jgi:transposase
VKQIKDYNPNQGYFISFYPEKFFKPNSLEMTIHEIFEKNTDLKPFKEKMKNNNKGQKEYSPKLLLKIIFYSYCKGIFSSHVMEENMHNNLSYIFLSGNNIIDHSTICRFINKYKEEIKDVFSKVLYVCWKLGLISLDMIAVDGTKLKANASKYFTGNRKQFMDLKERLKDRIDKLIERQARIDKKETKGKHEFEAYRKINREKKYFENAIEKIDNFFEKFEDKGEKINLTDVDCKVQKGENGKYFEGYNAQVVATDEVIIANDLTNHQSDRNELKVMIEKTDKSLKGIGLKEEEIKDIKIVGDAGYRNAEDIGDLTRNGYDLYIRMEKRSNPECSKTIGTKESEIKIEEGKKLLVCPGGRELKTCGVRKEKGNWFYKFYASRSGCKRCKYYDKCWGKSKQTSKKFAIKKEVLDNYKELKDLEEKLNTLEGMDIYNQRIGMIERVFGHIKSNLGFRRFYHRGLDKVGTIWSILCTAYNITKIYNKGLIVNI